MVSTDRPGSGRTLITAVAWTCVRDRRLLVARSHGSDAFYLPGGKPEPGETAVQTAVREVYEETGIRLDPATLVLAGDMVAPAHGRGPDTDVRLIWFTGDNGEAPRPCAEIAEVAWFTGADAHRCAPAIQRVLAALVSAGHVDR